MNKFIKFFIIFLLVVFFVAYAYASNDPPRIEAFTSPQPWTQPTVSTFLQMQKQMNPTVTFDLEEIQKQATEQDAQYFIQHGHWLWNEKTINIYEEYLQRSSTISIDAGANRQRDQSIYTNEGILMILSLKSKEGAFLLNGVTLPANEHCEGDLCESVKVLKCSNTKDALDSDMFVFSSHAYGSRLQDTTNTDHIKKVKLESYSSLPFMVPGFAFVEEPCNPCMALDKPFDKHDKCKFKIDTGYGPEISDVWKLLWGFDADDMFPPSNGHSSGFPQNQQIDDWFVRIFSADNSMNAVPPFNNDSSFNNDVSFNNDISFNSDMSYNVGEGLGIAMMFEETIPHFQDDVRDHGSNRINRQRRRAKYSIT